MGGARSSEVEVLANPAPGGGGGGGRVCDGAGGAAPGIGGGGRLSRLFGRPGEMGDSSSPPKELLLPVDRGDIGAMVGDATGMGGGGARAAGGASALGVSIDLI